MFNSVEDQITIIKEIVKNKVAINTILTKKDHRKVNQVMTQDEMIRKFVKVEDYLNVVDYFMEQDYSLNEINQIASALGNMNDRLTRKGMNRLYDVTTGGKTYQTIFENLKTGKIKDPVSELNDWCFLADQMDDPCVLWYMTKSVFEHIPCTEYVKSIHSEDPEWVKEFVNNYADNHKRKRVISKYHKYYRPITYQKRYKK